ncbi:hypothetical protein [Natrinema salsiterrestre]|nr:hypothetical protein [Natrinema salsiterrestre]
MDDDLPRDYSPARSPVASSLASRCETRQEDRQRVGHDHRARGA